MSALHLLAHALTTTLAAVTGAEFKVAQASGLAPDGELLVWRQEFRQLPGVEILLAAGAGFWGDAGRAMMALAGLDQCSDEEAREAWREIAAQTMGALATSLTRELGHEVSAGPGGEIPTPPDMACSRLVVQGPSGAACLLVSLPEDLLQPVVASEALPAETNQGPGKFDLLLDVALPVVVSFGRTSLQIREVIRLNSGSVIELDRLIHEPVDVMINNRTIAQGEVVVVDGNYGVRITRLVSREERIETGLAGAESFRIGAAA